MKYSDSAINSLSEVVGDLIDERTGIIRYVMEVPLQAGSPRFFHFYARSCDTRAFSSNPNSVDAGGASVIRDIALAKAIGEAVERYCSAIYKKEDFPLSSFEQAEFECISPEEFALYSPKQYASKNFPFVPFSRTRKVRWVPALSIGTGEIYHVPAAFVYVPYFYDQRQEEFPIAQSISTGLACHINPIRAAVSAICEVIERDAFTITWQAKLSRTKIRIETLSDSNREIAQRFYRTGGEISLLDLTMDSDIPVIMAVLETRALDAPRYVFAVSCSLDAGEAVRKALEELAHSHRYCRLLKSSKKRYLAKKDFSNITDRAGHVGLYCDHANAGLARFVFESKRWIDFSEVKTNVTEDYSAALNTLLTRLNAIGYRVLLVDVTTEDIRSLGLSVIRALIPGFQPLCIGHRLRVLGGSRLWEVPQKLGYKGLSMSTGDNPVPHPVP